MIAEMSKTLYVNSHPFLDTNYDTDDGMPDYIVAVPEDLGIHSVRYVRESAERFDAKRYSKVCRLLEEALMVMSEWGCTKALRDHTIGKE